MTDDTSAVEPDDDEIAIVPTGKAWLRLSERLQLLEAAQPAVGDDVDPHDRLDRHRAELEAIKRVLNDLIDYAATFSTDPAGAPQHLQPAPTSTTPTTEDYR